MLQTNIHLELSSEIQYHIDTADALNKTKQNKTKLNKTKQNKYSLSSTVVQGPGFSELVAMIVYGGVFVLK